MAKSVSHPDDSLDGNIQLLDRSQASRLPTNRHGTQRGVWRVACGVWRNQ